MPLMRLSYLSRPALPERGGRFLAACDDILVASRRRNAEAVVTGALVAAPNVFAQVLEGTREAVSETFLRICADRRHDRVRLVEAREVDRRRFPGWTMGFCDLDALPADVTLRYRHGPRLDLAALTPAAFVDFVEEAARLCADDNAILGAPRSPAALAPLDEIAFVEAPAGRAQ